MRETLETARHVVPVAKAKIAATVAFRSKKLMTGHNQAKTHPVAKRFGRNPDACYLHAEVDALYKASRLVSLHGADLYVARAWKGGRAAMSRPCSGCQRAIKFFGVARVFYTIGPNEYGSIVT